MRCRLCGVQDVEDDVADYDDGDECCNRRRCEMRQEFSAQIVRALTAQAWSVACSFDWDDLHSVQEVHNKYGCRADFEADAIVLLPAPADFAAQILGHNG